MKINYYLCRGKEKIMGRRQMINEEYNGIITTRELTCRKSYLRILRAVKRGELMRVKQGVYAKPQTLFNTMVDVERIVPNGVVCLYNAWSYYQLSTAIPPAICVAIATSRKVVLSEDTGIKLYYWKNDNLQFGIVKKDVYGFAVNITDLERSVCDAIKYRNKIGLDVCAEIVRSYLRKKERNLSRLMEYAKKLRVADLLGKYLEIALE